MKSINSVLITLLASVSCLSIAQEKLENPQQKSLNIDSQAIGDLSEAEGMPSDDLVGEEQIEHSSSEGEKAPADNVLGDKGAFSNSPKAHLGEPIVSPYDENAPKDKRAIITASDLYKAALTNNLRLQGRYAVLNAEREATREAWSALLPQMEATASYGVSQYRRDFGLDDSFSDREENARLDVTLRQVIYSQRTFENVRRAIAGEGQAEEELHAFVLETGGESFATYLDVLRLNREKNVLKREAENTERRLRQMTEMRERGLATRADELDAQATIDRVAADIQRISQDINVQMRALSAQTGLDLSFEHLAPVDETVWRHTMGLTNLDWLSAARNNAPSLRAASKARELAEATRNAERAGHMPELSLNARHTNNDTFATDLRKETRVEVQLRVPIYSGGGTSARHRQASYRLEFAEYELQDALQALELQVGQTTEQLRGSYQSIHALSTARESALASFEIAERGFARGVRSLNELLDAQQRVSDSERQLLREIYDNLRLQSELQQVAGTLSPEVLPGISGQMQNAQSR